SATYTINGTPRTTTWASPASLSIANADTATLNPGIYGDIKITGGTVTFNSGIYVLSSSNKNNGLTINGGTVTGSGVMFYATGATGNGSGKYDPTKSYSPVSNPPADSNNAVTSSSSSGSNLASFSVNGGVVNLTPITDTSSPF